MRSIFLAAALCAGSASATHACIASFYGSESGSRTATGERFDPSKMTAAHRTIRLGTLVRVSTGRRSIVVRINDRGPFVRGRCIDLARGAALALGISGLADVRLEVLQ